MPKKIFAIFMSLFCSLQALAQDDLEESTGLQVTPENETNSSSEAKIDSKSDFDFNYQSYIEFSGLYERNRTGSLEKSGKIEANLNLDLLFNNSWKIFFDGMAQNRSYENHQFSFLNAAGIRGQLNQNVTFAVGKERNRVAPGMIVAPSDLIHSSQAIPGAAENRNGEWISRVSYLNANLSTDLIYLISDQQLENGMIDNEGSEKGWFIRGTYRMGTELSFSYGQLQDKKAVGVFLQDMFFGNLRAYGEYSYHDYNSDVSLKDFRSYLVGFSYEGFKDTTVAGEYYFNGQGLDKEEWEKFYSLIQFLKVRTFNQNDQNIFIRQKYVIASIQYFPQAIDWQWTLSHIRSVEDNGHILLTKINYDLTANQDLSFRYMKVSSTEGSAYSFAPIDWQGELSWRYNF